MYNLMLLPDEADIINDECADLSTYLDESYTSFILGTLDINDDAVWEEYLETCHKLGLDTYITIYQGAYDRKYGG